MKKLLILISFLAIILIGCTNHKELAQNYKLELQYYDNSVKFTELNMTKQAFESCNMTKTLRSECFTTLAQAMIVNNIKPEKEYCDAIHPEEKMRMTKQAFMLVYADINPDFEKDINEKLFPSKQRINALSKIKEDCYNKLK